MLLWSVIAAAFIGPGTVATAASAGAAMDLELLWALAFSTIACFVLQEASARLTWASGNPLARALRLQFSAGWLRLAVPILVVGAVIVGCAAYEAGNVLGGVAGAEMALPLSREALTVLCGAAAAGLLFLGAPRRIALALSVLVAAMGVAFVATAVVLGPAPGELLTGTLVPRLPAGAGLLVVGLVGTTVVPYNLFLGSGLAKGGAGGEDLGILRFGLAVAVGLGGIVSMAVLVVGSAVDGELSFAGLAAVLAEGLGSWASTFFAVGLFAAGFSSAVTAPLAAAITARGLFGRDDAPERWDHRSWRYRAVWGGVLATGIAFGLSGVRPEPVILLAQALNGLLLPFVAVFLLLAVNDGRWMGERHRSGIWSNGLGVIVTGVTFGLGLWWLTKAAARAFGTPPISGTVVVAAAALGAVLTGLLLLVTGSRGDHRETRGGRS